ncbi:hypothetical protein BDV93DRAFT_516925 [Ceratobasidium sp. AG-I]|nr:hypothetical protein BDV93DRAFT_516925 [Ceratobasidium sp. AG-I]
MCAMTREDRQWGGGGREVKGWVGWDRRGCGATQREGAWPLCIEQHVLRDSARAHCVTSLLCSCARRWIYGVDYKGTRQQREGVGAYDTHLPGSIVHGLESGARRIVDIGKAAERRGQGGSRCGVLTFGGSLCQTWSAVVAGVRDGLSTMVVETSCEMEGIARLVGSAKEKISLSFFYCDKASPKQKKHREALAPTPNNACLSAIAEHSASCWFYTGSRKKIEMSYAGISSDGITIEGSGIILEQIIRMAYSAYLTQQSFRTTGHCHRSEDSEKEPCLPVKEPLGRRALLGESPSPHHP